MDHDRPSIFQLALPPLLPLVRSSNDDLSFVLADLGQRYTNPISCIGLEIRAAYAMSMDDRLFQTGTERSDENPSLHRFFGRLAIEPALLSFSYNAQNEKLSDLDMDELIYRLTHMKIPRAQNQMSTELNSRNSVTMYANHKRSLQWRGRLRLADEIENPIDRSIFVYSETVFAHPYQDGNGRLARSLLYLSLYQSGILKFPILPLGPIVYSNSSAIIRAFREISTTGDWNDIIGIMRRCIKSAAELSAFLDVTTRDDTLKVPC